MKTKIWILLFAIAFGSNLNAQNVNTYTATLGNEYSATGSFYSLNNIVYTSSVVFSHQAEIDIMYWYQTIGISAPYQVITPWTILNQTKFDTISIDSINFNTITKYQIDSLVNIMNLNSNITVLDTNILYIVKTGNTSSNYPKNAILKLLNIYNNTITFQIKITDTTTTNVLTPQITNDISISINESQILINSTVEFQLEYQITNLLGQVIAKGKMLDNENVQIKEGVYIISLFNNQNNYIYNKKICVK